jgi:cytoplasmic iron level regulating protein YaaA (DUF328/UPF0246 family)
MKTVYLVSCAAEKRASERPAEHLYCSDLFQKARAYALRNMGSEDQWYILSAKYGLLNPAMVVGPYNETLNNMRKFERTQWARHVESDLRTLLHQGDRVVFLAGQKYREFLEPSLLAWGCDILIPMRGMRIGEQLRWLGKAMP